MVLDLGITNVANTLAEAGVQPGTSTTATATDANAPTISQSPLDPGVTALSPTPLGPAAPKPLPVSTTTLSSANKQAQVPQIQATTNKLASSSGITTDASGTPKYANGTIAYGFLDGSTYDSAGNQISGPTNNNSNSNSNTTDTSTPSTTTATGGYNGEVYVPPGGTIPLGADGKPVTLTPNSPTNDTILKSLNDAKASADAMTATIIDSITKQYEGLIAAQKQTNAGAEANVNTALLMGGVTGQGSSSQYAPISSSGIIQSQVTYGLAQISNLQAEEQKAIVAAQQAGQNADFQLMDKINTQISKIRDEQVAAATKLSDTVTAAKSQATLDGAINKLYTSGVTDPSAILTELNKQGLKDQNGVAYSAKAVADSLASIKPTVDELNRQQAAVKFAIDNNVTQPFYLVGNTAIDSKTGLPVSLQQYQQATGQVGKTEAQTDFSKIQKLTDPQVQKLMDKYTDAKILPTDTLDQATAKLANSRIYQEENYIAKPAGTGSLLGGNSVSTVGGNNIVAGVKVPANLAASVEDVLAGRDTIQNIRLSLGRSTSAGNYILGLKAAIKSVDPNFDFVASDAGAKFVSSTYYQKASGAINSVLPNIDKIVDLSNQVSRIGVKGVDALLQKGAIQIGDQKVSNFHEAQKLIADEIGVALGAGSVSDMKLQLGFDVTDPSVSPEVFASNMGIVKDFIQNRAQGLKDQRYSSSVDTTGGSDNSGGSVIEYKGQRFQTDADGNFDPSKPIK